MSLQFAIDMAKALAERAKSPEMVKMRVQWKKSLTKTQKAKLEEHLASPLPKLKIAAATIAEKAPKELAASILAAIESFRDKEPLSYLLIDLAYGVVGSLPPEPLKISKKEELRGRAIKFGSNDCSIKEGIVTYGTGAHVAVNVFVPSTLERLLVFKEQIVGLGEMKVVATMASEQPAHAFTKADHSKFATTIPESKALKKKSA